MPVIEKYFGRIPKATDARSRCARSNRRRARRSTVILREAAQPFYLEGYHRPAATDPDDATYDAIEMLLSDGRTSRLYRSLVRDQEDRRRRRPDSTASPATSIRTSSSSAPSRRPAIRPTEMADADPRRDRTPEDAGRHRR